MTESFEKAAREACERAAAMCHETDPPNGRAEILAQAIIEANLVINSILLGVSYLSTARPRPARTEFIDAAGFALRLATWAPNFDRQT
jgi:hypothetical protein